MLQKYRKIPSFTAPRSWSRIKSSLNMAACNSLTLREGKALSIAAIHARISSSLCIDATRWGKEWEIEMEEKVIKKWPVSIEQRTHGSNTCTTMIKLAHLGKHKYQIVQHRPWCKEIVGASLDCKRQESNAVWIAFNKKLFIIRRLDLRVRRKVDASQGDLHRKRREPSA